MQLFKYVTLTLCQQQLPDDVQFHLEVNKVTCQKGLLKKMGKMSKEYEFNTKCLHGKAFDLNLKSRHEWGLYRIKSLTKSYNYTK